jgi:hypothetical protein
MIYELKITSYDIVQQKSKFKSKISAGTELIQHFMKAGNSGAFKVLNLLQHTAVRQ